MKSKISLLVIAFSIAGAAITGFNMAQNHNNLNISLEDIAEMAKADDGELPPVYLICDYPEPGLCWVDIVPEPWYTDCVWTGAQFDYCDPTIEV